MAIQLKTSAQINTLREGGVISAKILAELAQSLEVGMSTDTINTRAESLIAQYGAKAAFLGYTPRGVRRPYPASICVSINEEVVHGIPNEQPKTLQHGDVVKLDLGLVYKGLITDHAITCIIPGGETELMARVQKLIISTDEALHAGIAAAKVGAKIGDISHAIMTVGMRDGFGIVDELAGHGVGFEVHEEPFVPNVGKKGTGPTLVEGMVIAIEPMFTLGKSEVYPVDDYTYATADGSIASHIEHTIAITKKGPIILTEMK